MVVFRGVRLSIMGRSDTYLDTFGCLQYDSGTIQFNMELSDWLECFCSRAIRLVFFFVSDLIDPM